MPKWPHNWKITNQNKKNYFLRFQISDARMAYQGWWSRLFRTLPLVFTALLITGEFFFLICKILFHCNWLFRLKNINCPGISWTTCQLRWARGQSGWLCFFIPAQIFLNWIQVFHPLGWYLDLATAWSSSVLNIAQYSWLLFKVHAASVLCSRLHWKLPWLCPQVVLRCDDYFLCEKSNIPSM